MSKITKFFYFSGLLIQVLGVIDLLAYDIKNINGLWLLLYGIVLLVGTFYISQSSGWFIHRGAAHTWWFIALTVLPLYLIGFSTTYLIAAWIGGWTHLLFDSIPHKVLSVRPA